MNNLYYNPFIDDTDDEEIVTTNSYQTGTQNKQPNTQNNQTATQPAQKTIQNLAQNTIQKTATQLAQKPSAQLAQNTTQKPATEKPVQKTIEKALQKNTTPTITGIPRTNPITKTTPNTKPQPTLANPKTPTNNQNLNLSTSSLPPTNNQGLQNIIKKQQTLPTLSPAQKLAQNLIQEQRQQSYETLTKNKQQNQEIRKQNNIPEKQPNLHTQKLVQPTSTSEPLNNLNPYKLPSPNTPQVQKTVTEITINPATNRPTTEPTTNQKTKQKINKQELQFFRNIKENQTNALKEDKLKINILRRKTQGVKESRAEKHIRLLLEEQIILGNKAFQRGKNAARLNPADIEILQFLAMFKYATNQQIANLRGSKIKNAQNLTRKLTKLGLATKQKIMNKTIYYLTEAGMIMSGLDLKRVTEKTITYTMMPHQLITNHIAANLSSANLNVLELEDYPQKNRTNYKGEKVFGEQLISELQIQSSLFTTRKHATNKADIFVPEIKQNIKTQFEKWQKAGGTKFGPSPETLNGNEFMWALYPPYNLKKAYHVPDLVISRPRNPNGTPASIAVEIELSNKTTSDYTKTLLAYKHDRLIYDKVIWVVKSAGPKKKLIETAKQIGLWQQGRMKVVPIWTENGEYKDNLMLF